MGLDLPDGGHLTHGYKTPAGKKVAKGGGGRPGPGQQTLSKQVGPAGLQGWFGDGKGGGLMWAWDPRWSKSRQKTRVGRWSPPGVDTRSETDAH